MCMAYMLGGKYQKQPKGQKEQEQGIWVVSRATRVM